MKTIIVDPNNLNHFISFPKKIYQNDEHYVPYLERDLQQTLKRLLFVDKTYTALLVSDEDNQILGRVLFTINKNKQFATDRCGFFSMYECIDSFEASTLLLSKMKSLLYEQGAEYISGTYFPYDPDNRRGIMVQGFDRTPMIFTSYNPPYYHDQLSSFGFQKFIDTYEYSIEVEYATSIYQRFSRYFERENSLYRVDTVDWNNIDQDILDMQQVLEKATTEINYQEAPSVEELKLVLKKWRFFLNKDFLLIARKQKDNQPIGIAVALPDYFQVFQKMNGKTNLKGLLTFLIERKKICSIRAILQYVIPEYQKTKVLPMMYCKVFCAVQKHHIQNIEAGTIMENNDDSNQAIKKIGGSLSRIYRIYSLKLR